MAAGLGFKTFTTGEVLTAADVNGYLMQGILVFASEAARNSAITAPQEGQFAYTKDNNSLWYYTGSAWAASGATGDIEGVTAGVGISGGGTSGTVTITNSMATEISAKGDLVVGTGSQTFDNLTVGANNTVLTADSSTATGLKWATPASGSSFAGCLLYKTTTTTITNASNTTLAFDGEVYDTDGFHSTSSNTSRITIPSGKGGYYAFYGTAGDDNIAGTFLLLIMRLFKNGSTNIQITSDRQSANDKVAQFYIVVNAAAGDYFEFNLATYMSTNNALEAAGAIDLWQSFGCHYLGA
jgi:hypothetical protein